MALRYEAWDLPTNASTFQRKLADIPVILGTGTGYLVNGGGGGGEMAVPADFSRLSTIISSTEGSLIRVYDGTTLVHEWITERVDHDIIDGEGVVRISGPDVQALLGKAVVYAFDYPEQPSLDPDWHWGHDRNLLDNGGFEDNADGIPNKGFEDGTTDPWWAGAVDGVSATLAIDTGTVDAGTYAAKLDPLLAEGGCSVMANDLYGNKVYTVTARIRGANTVDYQLGASGPLGLVAGGSATTVEHSPGGQYGSPRDHVYEAQLAFTGTGAYATETLIFATAFGQNQSQINIREAEVVLNGSDVFIDDVSISGFGIGMDPWVPTSADSVITFEASTDVTADEGTYTGKVEANDLHGIYQTVDNVLEGVTYTASVRLRNTSGSARWSLEMFDNRGQRLDQATVVTTTAFQTLTVTAELPEGSRWMEVRVINHSGGNATIYLDNAKLYRGQAPATVGTILGQLFDDAQTDHSADDRGTILTWLDDSGFDGTNDSSTTAWAASISFSAFWGDTYLNVLRNLTKLDYEWNITPKASPTVGSTHDLNVYEPGGLGTDYSAAVTPAINIGQSTTGAALVQRIPGFTAVLAEGEEGIWDESEDATAQTNFGRWEEFSRALQTNSTTELNTLNTELLAFEARNRLAAKVDVVANTAHPTPLVDYTVGDTVNWQSPPTLTKEARVIQEISYRNSEPATYQITGSQVFHRETAAWEGLRRLLEEYRHRKRVRLPKGSREVDPVAGGGGAPTLVVAASDASAFSKERADFVCDGTDDDVTIQAAINALPSLGRLLLTEGTFSVDPSNSITVNNGISLQGLSSAGTVIQAGSASTLGAGTPAPLVTFAEGGRLSNIGIDANTFTDVAGVRVVGAASIGVTAIEDCWINADDHYGILVQDGPTRIRHCYIKTVTTGTCIDVEAAQTSIIDCDLEPVGIGIDLEAANCRVLSNYIDGATSGIRVGSTRDQVIINGNIVFAVTNAVLFAGNNDRVVVASNRLFSSNGIQVTGTSHLEHIYSSNVIEATQYGVYLNAAGIIGLVVSGNALDMEGSSHGVFMSGGSLLGGVIRGNAIRWPGGDGIRLAADLSAGGVLIEGNYIEQSDQHGIHLLTGGANGVSDCQILNNSIISAGQGVTNTYDGILLANDSNRNVITGNTITSDVTITTRNGINISAATCDDNQIGSNDFGTIANFGTAVISDSGTDTQFSDATTLAFSQSGTLSIGAGSFKWPMAPGDYMVIDAQGAVGTAPSGGPVTLDVNKNGTTIYSVATNPSIADGQTVGNAAKPDYTTLTTNDYVTVDVDAANSAADLTAIVRVLPL